jgi:flagellin-specific chaperone FliS
VASVQQLATAARKHYEKARQYLKEENWSGFGQEWQALQEVLQKLDSGLRAAQEKQKP